MQSKNNKPTNYNKFKSRKYRRIFGDDDLPPSGGAMALKVPLLQAA
ncbi:MAG: hypothetical protein ACSI46_03760 [Gloeotrichia echinulata DVL01]|jgi:hypothetical protein